MFESLSPLTEFRATVSGVRKVASDSRLELVSPVGDLTDYLLEQAERRALRMRILQRRPSLSRLADIYAEVADNPQKITESLTEGELGAVRRLTASIERQRDPMANLFRTDLARIDAFLSGVHIDSTSLNDHPSSGVLRPETVPMRYSPAARAAALVTVALAGLGTSSAIAGAIGYFYLSDLVLSSMGIKALYPMALFGPILPALFAASVADCIKDTWPGILD